MRWQTLLSPLVSEFHIFDTQDANQSLLQNKNKSSLRDEMRAPSSMTSDFALLDAIFRTCRILSLSQTLYFHNPRISNRCEIDFPFRLHCLRRQQNSSTTFFFALVANLYKLAKKKVLISRWFGDDETTIAVCWV